MLSEPQVFEFLGAPINKDKLDEELILFPQVAYAIAQYAKDAKLAKVEAKKEFDSTLVRAAKDTREEALKSGTKLTEAAIAEKAKTSPDHEKAVKAYQEAEARFIAIDALTESLDARESSYKLLVSLFNSSYWVANTDDRVRNG